MSDGTRYPFALVSVRDLTRALLDADAATGGPGLYVGDALCEVGAAWLCACDTYVTAQETCPTCLLCRCGHAVVPESRCTRCGCVHYL